MFGKRLVIKNHGCLPQCSTDIAPCRQVMLHLMSQGPFCMRRSGALESCLERRRTWSSLRAAYVKGDSTIGTGLFVDGEVTSRPLTTEQAVLSGSRAGSRRTWQATFRGCVVSLNADQGQGSRHGNTEVECSAHPRWSQRQERCRTVDDVLLVAATIASNLWSGTRMKPVRSLGPNANWTVPSMHQRTPTTSCGSQELLTEGREACATAVPFPGFVASADGVVNSLEQPQPVVCSGGLCPLAWRPLA